MFRASALRRVVTVSAAVVVAWPTVAASQPFEGALTMRLSSRAPGAPPPQEIEYLVRNGKVRVSMGGPASAMSLLSVPQEKKMYVLVAAQQSYMEMPIAGVLGGASAPSLADAKITRTGRMETVAGTSCEHVKVINAGQTVDVCIANGLGGYVNPLGAMQRGSEPAWQRMLAADGGFPLKVTMADGTVALEVVKIEKRRLANDLFSVPLNYTKLELPPRR